MRIRKSIYLFVFTLLTTLLIHGGVLNQCQATLTGERLLLRRQSEPTSGAPESSPTSPESTTAAVPQANNQPPSATQTPPARLYPDLPQHFNPNGSPRQQNFPHHHHQGQTPFVPHFGFQNVGVPGNNRNFIGGSGGGDMPMVMRQPQMISPLERLQSQTFSSGLGKRLLSMIGIREPSNETSSQVEGARATAVPMSMGEETMRALHNSTVLQQLNRGVQSLYGGLSRMYNSTVQQQLDLLQERFKKEAENSTQPWQQRMAQQVPQFFKTMAMKVNEAQENLNRIVRQVTQQASSVANSSLANKLVNQSQMAPQMMQRDRSSSFFDQFGNPISGDYGDESGMGMFQPGQFFNQIGRTLGFGADSSNDPQDMMNGERQQPRMDLGRQLMDFWHNQVQPQFNMMRGQIGRVWRDLSQSGMMLFDPMTMRSRNQAVASAPTGGANTSTELVDDILNGVDMNSSEFALINPKSEKPATDNSQSQLESAGNTLGTRMQNNIINMQREVNRLWNGLTNSLQNALQNVKSQMNPPSRFNMNAGSMRTNDNSKEAEVDPAENEIDGKLRELTKVQRDTDIVANVVQQQQQRAQQQQNQLMGGGFFRDIFNNMDFNGVQQLPNRVGDSVSRFGAAIGDFVQQIPRRWDNFVSMRQPELVGAGNKNNNINMGENAHVEMI